MFQISDFITFKAIRGLNPYRKPVVVSVIIAMILGISSACGKEPIGASHDPPESGALSEQIKELVKGLEYSDKVAQDFVKIVSGWKDAQGRPVLFVWKEKLTKAKEDYKQGKISRVQLAKIEENVAGELSQRIRKEFIRYEGHRALDLAEVIKGRRTQCSGYSLLVYIIGNSIGLSVRVIDVVKPLIGASLAGLHASNIVSLADGDTIMVDLFLLPGGLFSKPFVFEKEFAKVGDHWELRNDGNILRVHRRIQICDKTTLLAHVCNIRGVMYDDLGRFTQAVFQYDRAIKLNPKFALTYSNRGVAYSHLGQHTKAISDYTRAIELNPKCAEAYNNRGATYKDLGEIRKAISDHSRAIDIDLQYAEAYRNRGVAYAHLGQYSKAITDYDKAIELNPPEKAEVYYNRGNAYFDLRQYTKAISNYTKAIEFNPRKDESYYNRGNAYGRLGQHNEAISDYTKAIEINPKKAEAYYNRGLRFGRSGQYAKAISDFSKAIELDPKDARAYFNRGYAYALLGKSENAKKDLLRAVELKPAEEARVKNISDEFKLGLKLD